MPLPPPPTRKPDNAANRLASRKADKELLLKGVLCALIGSVILVAPYVARSASVQELMAGASVVGWFSLALGCAFIVLYLRRQVAARRSDQG
jgi:drug/metabolite transporter (DMT)-like permease